MTRSTTRYAALALIDTQANYLIVKAFQYTSLTGVTVGLRGNPFDGCLARRLAACTREDTSWAEPPP